MPIEKLNPLRYLGPAEYTGFWQQLFATLLYGFWGRVLFIALVVSIGASLATIAGYDRWFAQKVVAVDIKGYIAQQRDSYLAGKLNDDELKKSFDRLEAVITTIPKNRVVIMGDAVVRNAETVKP